MADRAHPFYDLHTHGFVRVATCTPRVRPADVTGNTDSILEEARHAHEAGVDLAVYPELCVTGYAIDDLHLQAAVIDAAEAAIGRIVEESAGLTTVLVVGAPIQRGARLYNCALAIADGRLLADRFGRRCPVDRLPALECWPSLPRSGLADWRAVCRSEPVIAVVGSAFGADAALATG